MTKLERHSTENGPIISAIRTLVDRIQGKAPPGAKRSSSWSATRKRFMRSVDRCAVCPRTRGLEAHHVIPFHIAPDLELEPENLIALCRRCHLFVGHLCAWARFNPSVRSEARYWRFRLDGG